MKNIYHVFRILCSLEGFLWFWLECGVDRQKTAKIALRQLRGAVKKNFPDHDPFKFRYIILEGSLSMQNDRNSWLQSCGRSARVCNPACLNMIIERMVNGGLLPVGESFHLCVANPAFQFIPRKLQFRGAMSYSDYYFSI